MNPQFHTSVHRESAGGFKRSTGLEIAKALKQYFYTLDSIPDTIQQQSTEKNHQDKANQ